MRYYICLSRRLCMEQGRGFWSSVQECLQQDAQSVPLSHKILATITSLSCRKGVKPHLLYFKILHIRTSLVAQMVKNLPAVQETWVQSLGCEDPLEKGKATHSTSWQIDGETMETVADFIFGGSKITADGDCSHEIKRRLLFGRKVMTNLDNLFKSRDITLPIKVSLVKAMVYPVVMYGCESWTIKKAER